MYSTLDELHALISERLHNSFSPIRDMRILVDDLSIPGRIQVLINAILSNEVQLREIASKSYTHNNGFDKITLLTSAHPSYTLRLHIWWPDQFLTNSEHIHNHSWDFSSSLLTGAYYFQTFEVSDMGDQLYHYRCGFPVKGMGYKMDYLGISRVSQRFDCVMLAGELLFAFL